MITIIARVLTLFSAMTGSYPHCAFNYNVFTRVILSPKICYKVWGFLFNTDGLGRGTGRVLLKVTLSRQG